MMLYWLRSKNFDCHPIFINYGQISFKGELNAARKISDSLKFKLLEIDIPGLSKNIKNQLTCPEKSSNSFFPNRNLILLSIASMISYENKYDGVAIGLIRTPIYPDTKKNFIENYEKLNHIGLGKKISIIAPFIDMNKNEVVEIGNNLKVPYSNTYSCFTNQDSHCGNCESCKDRKKALGKV